MGIVASIVGTPLTGLMVRCPAPGCLPAYCCLLRAALRQQMDRSALCLPLCRPSPREAGDEAGRAGLKKDLSSFHEAWQGIARDEVHFMIGSGMSGDVGKAVEFEEIHPASLVIGRGCGKPKFFRCTATRWCVRRLQEAANG